MNNFRIAFHDLEPKFNTSPPDCWCSAPVLSGYFVFDWQSENKELITMGAWGPAADSRRRKFAERVDKHPEWSDAQITAFLKDAGARFAPEHRAEFSSSCVAH